MQELVYGGFKWMENMTQFDSLEKLEELLKSLEKGYLLEVDIEYPKELHDAHNDLPFLPETKEVNKVKKLIPNLFNKESYCLDIRILIQALQNGLKLTKVHRVIQYDQKVA